MVERAVSLRIARRLVYHEIIELDAAVGASFGERDCAIIQEFDEMRARDVEEIGCLLRGQRIIDGRHYDGFVRYEVVNQLTQRSGDRGRQRRLRAVWPRKAEGVWRDIML
jgi:hypothetical protein